MRATHDGEAEERVLGEAPAAPAGLWERVLGAIDVADADLGLLPADEGAVGGDLGGEDAAERPAGVERASRPGGEGRDDEADDDPDRAGGADGDADAPSPGPDGGWPGLDAAGLADAADDPPGPDDAAAGEWPDDPWGDDDGLG